MKKIFIEITVVSEKEIWMQLMEDIYNSGLIAEFADFYLENPGMSILEINREFRDEWDI